MKACSNSESASRSTTLTSLFGTRQWCDGKVVVHLTGKKYFFVTLFQMAQAAQEDLNGDGPVSTFCLVDWPCNIISLTQSGVLWNLDDLC